tara:strand:- start:689 stop:1570 length:882 start_codon:yes stop_codon:yes gene_type:complete
MKNKVFITCAVTGSGETTKKNLYVPITPKQIAESVIESAKAGAAIAHIHVREKDGSPSRKLELYREVVDRIRSHDLDIILNLTTGMGGDLEIGNGRNPLKFGLNTDMINIMERIAHVEELLPEICTLDCGSLNFGDKSMLAVNTPDQIRKAAKRLKQINVKPEIEAFDLGNMWFGQQLYKEGLLKDPPMFQICLGIPWGAPPTVKAMQAMIDLMPEASIWSGFAISKNEMPFVAQTVIMGGNPRVGLEDNLYLSKGKLATNAQLVEKAVTIVENLGVSIMTPAETRDSLKLSL